MALPREGELSKANSLFYDSYSWTYAIRFIAPKDYIHKVEIYLEIQNFRIFYSHFSFFLFLSLILQIYIA